VFSLSGNSPYITHITKPPIKLLKHTNITKPTHTQTHPKVINRV